jgi:hypothetical protein
LELLYTSGHKHKDIFNERANQRIIDQLQKTESTHRGLQVLIGFDEIERFVELIIKECSQACLDEAEKFRGEQDITDFKICALVIKEHFGVE